MEKNKEYENIILSLNEFKQNDDSFLCPICFKKISKYGIKNHLKYSHFGFIKKFNKQAWNKGLTKENSEIIKKSREIYCKKIKEGLIIPPQKGKPVKEEIKKKISLGMKKAHKEGRAWNIGKSRWNNKQSYPEKFFINVIENEFEDKNFVNEFSFGIYSLDFAWPHLKKCIEIDGDQHYRFKEYIERDIKKDKYIIDNEWKILRIRWKDFFNNPKKYIKIAKNFIEKDIDHLDEFLDEYKKEKELKEKNMLKKEINKCHEIALKINLLLDSDIDFNKYGWVKKAANIINISSSKCRNWIKKNYPKILDNSKIRNL